MGAARPSNTPGSAQLTPTQQKLLAVLQEPTSRGLLHREICQKAGISRDSFYSAFKNPTFSAVVEAGGIMPRRNSFGKIDLTKDPDEEWAKDIVDLRRLVDDYPKHRDAGQFKLNFSFITNPALKDLVKRYFRARISFWKPQTHVYNLYRMKPFFVEVGRTYPSLTSFSALTRRMIEPALTASCWTDERGQQRPMSRGMKRRMCLSLDTMFTYMMMHDWPEAPKRPLIYDEDKPPPAKTKPRPIPPAIMEQLLAHVASLPPHARNVVEIMAHVGLRAEDALHVTEDCLDHDAANDPILRWFNHKMNRDGRPLPVSEVVVAAIERQRDLVKGVPDHFGQRYLFRTQRGLYSFTQLCYHLNKLATTIPILDAHGQVYRFRPHALRHTVGTRLLKELERHSSNQHWRKNPVILSGSATSAGISHASLTLKTVGMADLLDGVKSDANRTFDYLNGALGIVGVKTYLDHESLDMSMRYAEITNDDLKALLRRDLLAKPVAGGAALAALAAKVRAGDESDLDWLASRLHKLIHPNGYCLHHPKSPLCPYGQNVCFHTPRGGPCEKLVITEASAPRIITTLEDLRTGYRHAKESGTYDGSTYLRNLENEMRGMEMKLAQFDETLGAAESRDIGVTARGLRDDIAKILHHRQHDLGDVTTVKTGDGAAS